MKFRKRPIVIDAIQYLGYNTADVADFMETSPQFNSDLSTQWIEIDTLEGVMRGDIGDWIIKGIRGEFYPCKPDVFDKSYEPA